MPILKPEEKDFSICQQCGARVLVVGYWDDKTQKAESWRLNETAQIAFDQRDRLGRLIVWDAGAIRREWHGHNCSALPSDPWAMREETDEESKPYQR